jgi:hypothetical protein
MTARVSTIRPFLFESFKEAIRLYFEPLSTLVRWINSFRAADIVDPEDVDISSSAKMMSLEFNLLSTQIKTATLMNETYEREREHLRNLKWDLENREAIIIAKERILGDKERQKQRLVTVLITMIVSITRLRNMALEKEGPIRVWAHEEAPELLFRVVELYEELVGDSGGQIEKFIVRGLLEDLDDIARRASEAKLSKDKPK